MELSLNKKFLICLLLFLSGIFIFNIYFSFYNLIILGVFLLIITINYNLYFNKELFNKFIILVFFSFILWWITWQINYNNITNKEQQIEKSTYNYFKKVKLKLKIENKYKAYEIYTSYIASILKIEDKKIDNISLLVNIFSKDNLNKNDIIIVDNRVDRIDNFVSTFDYHNFMISKNIYWKINVYSIDKENFIIWNSGIIYNTRQLLLSHINSIFPEQEANLLSWILIWARENLSKKLKDNFNNSWLTHIIAVSWYNITIIIIFVSFFIKYLPYRLRPFVVAAFVSIFVLIVWVEPPVLRAAIMWVMWYFIVSSWRESNPVTLLLISAVFMAVLNPFILNFDISFWLSFLSVLWLIFVYSIVEKKLIILPKFIRDNLSLALAAFIFNLPILIYFFWEISIIFIISNLLVLFAIPFAMLFWFIAIIFNMLSLLLGKIVWFVAYVFLHYIIIIVNFLWEFKYAKINLDFWSLNIYFLIIYYLIIILALFKINNKKTTVLE